MPANTPDSTGRAAKYLDKLIDTAVLTIPTGLIVGLCAFLQKQAFDAPWTLLLIAVPVSVSVWLVYRHLRHERAPLRHWRWFALLAIYCSLFSAMNSLDPLRWRTVALPKDQIKSRPWVLPVRLGDWHYAVARRQHAYSDVLGVLLLQPGASIEITRGKEAQAILAALQADNLIGIALDVYFEDTSAADAQLCAAIAAAESAKVPVFSGYSVQPGRASLYARFPDKPPLPCLPSTKQGHLLGFKDFDGRIRAQQLWFNSRTDLPSFSMRAANAIRAHFKDSPGAESGEPDLTYLPPAEPIATYRLEEVTARPGLLNDKFLLVGLDTPADRFDTPFGRQQPGTLIQAYAVHSLLTGNTIHRLPPLWSAAIILASCSILMMLAMEQRGARALLLTAALHSLLIVAIAALCMFTWNIWVDVVYALTAIWLWLPVLFIARPYLPHPSPVDEPPPEPMPKLNPFRKPR